MGFFDTLSKTALTIWFIFLVKEGIMVLHMCGKFHVHKNSGSRDMGAKGVKLVFFGLFSKKKEIDLVHSPRERRYYCITCACQIS